MFPLKEIEFVGLLVIAAFLFVSNIGGIGGGGTIIPVVLTFFNFDIKNAVTFSNASIFLAATIRNMTYVTTPHPLKNGKGLCVDMNITLIMLPMISSGVIIGTIFNIYLPN